MVLLTRSCILFVAFLFSGLDKTIAQELVYNIPCETHKSDGKEMTMETIATNLTGTERADVLIHIEKHYLNMNQPVTFKRLNSLIINGHPNLSTIINCTPSPDGAGITIENVRNITLNDLMLIACGSQFMVSRNNYSSALTLKLCSDVNIKNLVITKSQGIGLMIYNHTGGRVLVSTSNFTENKKLGMDDNEVRSGGGVFIGYFSKDSNNSITFEFEDCQFEGNVAHTKTYNKYYTDEFGNPISGHGQGGGAYVALENDIKHSYVEVVFINCMFNENQGFLGGGLAIKIGRRSLLITITKITITVENSEFISNGCDSNTKIGGGVHLRDNLIKSRITSGSKYIFQNTKFTKNCADFGGGIFLFSNRYNSSDNSLLFDNCTFQNNKAHIGSAVDLTPSSFVKFSDRHTIVPVISNCLFLDNNVSVHYFNDNNAQRTAGIGTLYASHYKIKFYGENAFQNNNGTALYMVNSMVDFTDSDATFNGNRGISGGAIALTGTSVMVFGPDKQYTFMNNTAIYRGGALFVMMNNHHDFTISKSCFIQFYNGTNYVLKFNNTITFSGNNAPVGKAIFATSLHPCQIIKNVSSENVTIFTTVNASEVFTVRDIDIDNSEIATEGAQLHLQEDIFHLIPGRQYKHNVTIKDDMNNIIEEPLRISIQDRYHVDPDYYYTGERLRLLGEQDGKANLTLQTLSTRQSSITFEVELEECPPGFKLESKECKCNFEGYYGLLKCDDDFHSLLTPGLWAGMVKDETTSACELVTSICPRSFCNYNNTLTNKHNNISEIKLPWKSSALKEAICGKARKGVLCGECAKGYTTYFHSPDLQCKEGSFTLCKGGWFFYILSELVPVTIVFITALVFNINFTSGAVNGFILFSQVLLSLNIDASGIITFTNKESVTQGYQFLYGFLNLDFFTIDALSFCLWPNATALDMLAFKYITIVYALSLVILVICFMNKCGGRCTGRWCRITKVRSSVIHGISAFFIICYSQSIMVSSSLLNGVELWHRVNSSITIHKRVWHNGEIHYFHKKHLPYALPALLCISTIGILPPILLIVHPAFNKMLAFFSLEESLVARFVSQKLPFSSLKPLLDSFQGCFKDNLRFFAGLYFLYRWIAPIVNSTTSSLGTAYIATEILLILMLALHSLFHPYQNKVHNVVDTLLFTNLLLINSLSCINYFLFQSQENRQFFKKKVEISAAIQMILLYLPLFIVFLYLLVVGCKQVVLFWSRSQHSFEEEADLPRTQMRRLRAVVRSMRRDIDDNDLPHRLIAGEVSYECFEDVDCAQETYSETKSTENAVTY